MTKNSSFLVRLPEKQLNALNLICKENNLNRAAVIRNLIDNFIFLENDYKNSQRPEPPPKDSKELQ